MIGTLQKEIREHEPMSALDGGDSEIARRRIAKEASANLKKKGFLMLEIGSDQAEAVTELLEAEGVYEGIEVHQDLAGLDRIVFCRKRDQK